MKTRLKIGLMILGLTVTQASAAIDAQNFGGLLSANTSLATLQTADVQTIALGGYDPTQYFAGGLPKLGDTSISYVFEGQLYYFTSITNRDLFIADPMAYAPQYGGHCAFAVAEHKTMLADPNVFAIEDGKLFVFQNEEKLEMWKTNSRKFRLLADKRWELEAKNFSKYSAKF